MCHQVGRYAFGVQGGSDMLSYEPRTEQRQHLNLSNHAYETILNDIDAFGETGGISGMINRILTNYMDESEASISASVERKRTELIRRIMEVKQGSGYIPDEDLPAPTAAERKVIDLLAASYEKELKHRFIDNPAPKEKTLKIRLQNEIYDILGPAVPLADEDYRSAGNYIKAIIEDYASGSFYRREEIYFRDIYELIRSKLLIPAESRPLMTIRIKTASGTLQDFRVKLYSMSSDSDSPYHYLLTLSKPAADAKADYKPAVFRLSRIIKLYDTPSYGSGKITAKENKALASAVNQKGIPYLLDDIDEYKIRLTPAGVKMYRSILHLRPAADDSRTTTDGSGAQTMYFLCTYRQIENYFFKFGKEAKILSPKEDAVRFKEAYLAAYKAY